MPNPMDSLAEPYNYQQTSKRNGQFIATYFKAALGLDRTPLEDPEAVGKQMQAFMMDALGSLDEVKRLYGVLDGLKRKHMPHAGTPGAPVKCTSCSMHGGEVPWPCETYKAADSALPEGWPL